MKKSMLWIGACAACMAWSAQAQELGDNAPLVGRQIKVENLKVLHKDNTLLVDMDLNLDDLTVESNNRLVFTVVVKDADNERVLSQVVVNGRKQQISYERMGHKDFAPGTTVVRRRNHTPQTVHYSGVIPGEAWMKNADVVVEEDLCGCGDVLDQTATVINRMRTPLMAYLRPAAEARKERKKEGKAYLDFPVNRVELHPDYRKNPQELQKIINTIEVIKNDPYATITSIRIHGYASPEDTYKHNTYLAEHRALTLKDYVRSLLKLDDALFRVDFTPEDWEGLRSYVAQSGLPHKHDILTLIDDTTLDIDAKERRIRATYPEDYRHLLEQCYPALRHSDYTVAYEIRAFSVEEAKQLLYTQPQQLSLEEIFLVAQTYEPGSEAFKEVMEIAVRMYPDDPTANLNAACTQIQDGNYAKAVEYLDKAGNSGHACHARGVLALLEGCIKEARLWLERARDAGVPEAAVNLKNLDLDAR